MNGLILLIGFPNNKFHPNTNNYLPWLLWGWTFSIRRKGLGYFGTPISKNNQKTWVSQKSSEFINGPKFIRGSKWGAQNTKNTV
jgi:hypothetical protein